MNQNRYSFLQDFFTPDIIICKKPVLVAITQDLLTESQPKRDMNYSFHALIMQVLQNLYILPRNCYI